LDRERDSNFSCAGCYIVDVNAVKAIKIAKRVVGAASADNSWPHLPGGMMIASYGTEPAASRRSR
jgi:hypothetical protein